MQCNYNRIIFGKLLNFDEERKLEMSVSKNLLTMAKVPSSPCLIHRDEPNIPYVIVVLFQ